MTIEERIKDIKTHPERHKHFNLEELTNCCMNGEAINLMLMDLHSQYVDMGTNGGVRCDVREGPCACGAWH